MSKADEDAIREIELRFNEAWERHDADGMVESLTDDAQFVTCLDRDARRLFGLDETSKWCQRAVSIEHARDARNWGSREARWCVN